MSSPSSAASTTRRRLARHGLPAAGPALLVAFAIVVLAAVAVSRRAPPLAAGWADAPPELRAVLWPEPQPIGSFELLDQSDRPFGPEQLYGRWSFLFFGYLQCPDVCPTTMQLLREFRRELAAAYPDGLEHQVVFVSVDPAYDRPAGIAAYLNHFDPAFVGLSGEADSLARLAGPLAIKYFEYVDDQGRRSIDHTSSIMIVDPRGRVVGAFPPPQRPEQMLALFLSLRRHLSI